MRLGVGLLLAGLLAGSPVAVAAQSPRDQLVQASFQDRDRAAALRRVNGVIAATERSSGGDTAVVHAAALGYRAKLTGSRSDLSAAKKLYDGLLRTQPGNPEVQLGVGAWHLGVIGRAGTILGRVFGATRRAGDTALERSVALGGNRAFFAGVAGMLRIKDNPGDMRARQFIERAVQAAAPTPLDQVVQRSANAVLSQLRAGNAKGARDTAARLLPFGTIPGMAG